MTDPQSAHCMVNRDIEKDIALTSHNMFNLRLCSVTL